MRLRMFIYHIGMDMLQGTWYFYTTSKRIYIRERRKSAHITILFVMHDITAYNEWNWSIKCVLSLKGLLYDNPKKLFLRNCVLDSTVTKPDEQLAF